MVLNYLYRARGGVNHIGGTLHTYLLWISLNVICLCCYFPWTIGSKRKLICQGWRPTRISKRAWKSAVNNNVDIEEISPSKRMWTNIVVINCQFGCLLWKHRWTIKRKLLHCECLNERAEWSIIHSAFHANCFCWKPRYMVVLNYQYIIDVVIWCHLHHICWYQGRLSTIYKETVFFTTINVIHCSNVSPLIRFSLTLTNIWSCYYLCWFYNYFSWAIQSKLSDFELFFQPKIVGCVAIQANILLPCNWNVWWQLSFGVLHYRDHIIWVRNILCDLVADICENRPTRLYSLLIVIDYAWISEIACDSASIFWCMIKQAAKFETFSCRNILEWNK